MRIYEIRYLPTYGYMTKVFTCNEDETNKKLLYHGEYTDTAIESLHKAETHLKKMGLDLD